jgi:hypothetical protein
MHPPINLFYRSPTSAIMPKSCIICSTVASPDLQLQYCAACQSALYCSKACQRKDWKPRHKKICKLLNVGHGDMQVRDDDHTSGSIKLKEGFETLDGLFEEVDKKFFKLFLESTEEESRAAAQNMKKLAKRQSQTMQKAYLFHSLHYLTRCDSKKLSWPSSPLLLLLQFVDPNVLAGNADAAFEVGETRDTLLHFLSCYADPFDYSTHENQLILAKQLIERGADVSAKASPRGETPLHSACHARNVTNLDFVQLLLEKGADPNAQDHSGRTPLMYTIPDAPGAAKYLLNWPTTNTNITNRSGESFLDRVRLTITAYSHQSVMNPSGVQVNYGYQFKVQQWRDIEMMIVERNP